MADIVRVIRVIEYTGPRDWVEKTLSSSIHGEKHLGGGRVIRAATSGEFPEIIQTDEGEES